VEPRNGAPSGRSPESDAIELDDVSRLTVSLSRIFQFFPFHGLDVVGDDIPSLGALHLQGWLFQILDGLAVAIHGVPVVSCTCQAIRELHPAVPVMGFGQQQSLVDPGCLFPLPRSVENRYQWAGKLEIRRISLVFSPENLDLF